MALAANALTTVETLAGELGMPVPAAGSAAERDLERRIAVASQAVEDYCGRRFGQATVTEKVRGTGGQVLLLGTYPVASVTSVTYDGQVVATTEYECEGLDAATGLLRHRFGEWVHTADWQQGAGAERQAGTERPLYVVVYVAGYVLPKDATPQAPATLPAPLEEACLLAAVASYRSKGRDGSIAAESLLSGSVTYRNPSDERGASGLPLAAEALLQTYRRLY